MKTNNEIIAESTEFVFEEIGRGGIAKILRFAPVTRENGIAWVHSTWARESTLEEMRGKASIIWRITSLWNPGTWKLVYQNAPAAKLRRLSK